MNELQLAKVTAANKVIQSVLEVVRAFDRAGIPWCLENPASSLLWSLPPVRTLLSRPRSMRIVTDQCLYGRAWKKRTVLLIGNVEWSEGQRLARKCVGNVASVIGLVGDIRSSKA